MSDSIDYDFGAIDQAVRKAIQEAKSQGFVAVVVTGKVSPMWWHAVAAMLKENRQDMMKAKQI
jgi:ABC-type protease/lipase transport system fused ATPase/permease subunit